MKAKRPVQYFSKAQLENSRDLTPEQIVEFIENFRSVVQGREGKRKLISLRVPENLLDAFKAQARRDGKPYQTRIVELMRDALRSGK